jgi:AAA domain
MKEIDLKALSASTTPANTFLIYGDTRTGKTTFAGTFPRPLIFADVSEKGYESLTEENWNESVTPLFEPGVRPIVWGIEKQSDMAECVARAEPLVKAGRVKSIFTDSLSFYADLYMNFVLMKQDKRDTRGAYGELGIHLRNLRISVHGLGCNVGWLCLAKHPEREDGKLVEAGGPLIPGQQAAKFAAGVDFILHTRLETAQPSQPGKFQIRTKRYMDYIAGNRLGGRANLLPDPFTGNYAALMQHLGYDVDAIRKALPPIVGNGAVHTAAPRPVTPPVVSGKPKITVVGK